jgi:5-oxoprolinase (ATP-hydrolysing)
MLDPLAGVLSALGIGLAQRRCIRRRSVEESLDAAGLLRARALLATLGDLARDELERQGLAAERIDTRVTARLRAAGSDTSLEVEWGTLEAMREAFTQAHDRLYGFAHESGGLVVAEVAAEAIERAGEQARPEAARGTLHAARGESAITARTWMDGAWREVPLYPRERLREDQEIAGPALVSEHGSTGWIAAGWRAQVGADGRLLVTRSPEACDRPAAEHAAADPMRLEVFNALFMHVAEQMGVVLRQTASSVNIKERLDFSCAIFDGEANLVANAPHMPVHLGSMGASVAAVLDAHGADLRPGDAFLVNSPYEGGTHLPDMTVVTPVFDSSGRRVEFFTASRAHHADVGGITPGSMPPGSRDIREEGALFSPLRIVRDGQLAEEVLRERLLAGPWPARNLPQNLADLRAQLAANTRGIREIERAARAHGLPVLLAYMRHVQDNAEACMRRAIRRLSDGRFRYALDNGQDIVVGVAIDRDRGEATVDFTGTSPQHANNFNAPRAVTTAAVLYVFRTLIEESIPLNAGCLRPLRIVLPRGSMLDPTWPHAVVAGNVETSQCIVDALYGALGLQAASQGTMNNLTFGNERYQYYETIAGGAGAGPGFHGASGVQTHMTNSRLTDPEILERRFPVLLRRFALRPGSGGAGEFRGGDGLVRRLEFRETMTVAILSNHRRVPPFGLAGGRPGQPGVNRLERRGRGSETLAATAEVEVQPGDCLQIETPGGGGFGRPAGR